MSLNKFTDINQTKKWMNVSCNEIKCDILTAGVQNIEELNVDVVIADEIKANSVIVGGLEMPSLDVVQEFSSVQTNNAGVLSLQQQLPGLSFSSGNCTTVGAIVIIPTFPLFTEPDTDRTAGDVRIDFASFHPKGLTINKTGLYRVTGSAFATIAQSSNGTYMSVLVNGVPLGLNIASRSSTGTNTGNGWTMTDYVQLTAGQRISVGLSQSQPANTGVIGLWKVSCEFIR